MLTEYIPLKKMLTQYMDLRTICLNCMIGVAITNIILLVLFEWTHIYWCILAFYPLNSLDDASTQMVKGTSKTIQVIYWSQDGRTESSLTFSSCINLIFVTTCRFKFPICCLSIKKDHL